MKKGRSLELLVSHLEKVLGHDMGVRVESPKRLPDLLSSGRKLREHDVVVSVERGHHKLIIAIECRDRSRPVGVPQVEAFYTKCQHTGVNQGIIVSTQGFCQSAKEKAEKLSVRCLSLEQATSFPWLLAPGLQMRKRRPKHLVVTALAEGAELDLSNGDYELVDLQGSSIPAESLLSDLLSAFEKVSWDPESDCGISELTAVPHGVLLRDRSSGKLTPITRLDCKLQYETTTKLLPFELISYTDEGSGQRIAEAAFASIEEKSARGRFVIVYDEEKGGGVYFVKEPEHQALPPNPTPAADG